jgi:hypothetical protein
MGSSYVIATKRLAFKLSIQKQPASKLRRQDELGKNASGCVMSLPLFSTEANVSRLVFSLAHGEWAEQ